MVRRFLIVAMFAGLSACDDYRPPPPLPSDLTFRIKFIDGTETQIVAIGCQSDGWLLTTRVWECSKAVPDGGNGFWHRKVIAVYPVSSVKSIEEVEK